VVLAEIRYQNLMRRSESSGSSDVTSAMSPAELIAEVAVQQKNVARCESQLCAD
jgi:hypothetical protein